MTDTPFPVLWLYGPPGVGKTTVGWEIYHQLVRDGSPVGYVDIDQVGICYPEPTDDPGRHRLKARTLAALLPNYRSAGARGVVVSGVVDPTTGPHLDLLTAAAVTVCRLHADPTVLAERFVARTGDPAAVSSVLRGAAVLDTRNAGDGCVETTGLTVTEVAERVRAQVGDWLVRANADARLRPPPKPTAASGAILWLCGAAGVGKSTVGFRVYRDTLWAGRTTGYVDLEQLGFGPGNVVDHHLRAQNLTAVWRTFRQAGAERLVVVGPAEDETVVAGYTTMLPGTTVTLCRLHAGRTSLTHRILSRSDGGSWAQPGDPLRGMSTTDLLRVADKAVGDAEALEKAACGHRIDTDGRDPDDVAHLVVSTTGWLSPGEGGMAWAAG
ncbi:hypothetical protein [Micromonospora cathayae]|uniref:AAA domain-containing protein n=1 Tax=Micromonospora cathayae TaxID=3028804 RepID=A0ABY7ZQI7_9ACTN|nr:hypothetical protein [Micromonospora sp. HUAS 3]WDZ84224.1 hypothetical protein PVK37_27810 [Micromonospora sp. HUAS 3]